ncbi:lipid-A-disaccharide synthase [Desertifilum sp. FACHB-1129]|uniref:Lipid-A-disaccharide synthase n=1 Tax=Desertifilum tharense IPPAS B-1220 TaxID=1781255 RepID=A0A1E5QMH8_9CYAN|nr:lipid-A-disaccharide synthase [Desertifilum tharense]MBD2313365.1 lipid-A-disaccharide synthase [Desertifilum sp. FACHB-1129]MBD2324436.1 lipid-A-disaccharide synthase [Desertifilum sp. FACHB-866]MBD2334450.1 lipid-A-disaccharide synthase [Desertifilum sp. FACHB-868]MDA0212753.1 lipid-A-disaccharide synthase [Cyanobacteria bacterium FC1]OEJ75886.1 lipid-A-disaccharide synthase [Desertifilum tharense IPPAS B-1220]
MKAARIFISTGEVSGDLQGALLVEALKRQAQAVEIMALGGTRMAEAGARLLANTSGIGSVGLWESVPFLLPTLRIQQQVKQFLREQPPDLVVLIDYMGPNLGIGSFLRRHFPQIPIVYYIAPQAWVWSLSPKDTERIVKVTDRLLAIFPAEARYFEQHGAQVRWVGHPLIDRIGRFPSRTEARMRLGIDDQQQAIALIPASRRQELKYLMPPIFKAAQQLQAQLPNAHFWIPLSLERYRPAIEKAIAQFQLKATLVAQQTPEVLAAADLAITKSGTVNLELALLNVPQVVLYRVSPLTYWIGKRVFNFSIPFMSPPNLVQMQAIVPEFLQEQATPEAIFTSALDLLQNPQSREAMQAGYHQMRQALGEPGVCDRAAQEILQLIEGDR